MGRDESALAPAIHSLVKQPTSDTRSRSRGVIHPSLAQSPAQQRAQGMPDASARPQPCVRIEKAHKRSHHGHTGNARHSPRNGFNGFLRDLPGEPGLLSPSPADHPANLTPASGRQDHTTSPSARWCIRLAHQKRPPHPAPNVRDDRETPL